MSREFNQHSLIAHDLFDRDNSGFGAACAPTIAANEDLNESSESSPATHAQPRRAKISEELWEDARRRHCDARQNWRSLLDRFVKPHH